MPLLSYLIALMVPLFGGNYYLAGTMMIPWLASLFILPLGIYFYRIGLPSAGLLGGLVATFSSEYFMRWQLQYIFCHDGLEWSQLQLWFIS